MSTEQKRTLIMAGFVATFLVACADAEKNKSATQIAARVNKEEVTVHQLNYALSHTGLTGEGQAKQVTPKLLKNLIDQSLLVQQALTEKLDRDPAILLALENAKSQVLSEAWLARHIQGMEKPTAQEVTEFNKAHPELFEKRKIYQIKELLIERTADNHQKLEQLLKDSGNVNVLAENLAIQKIPFKENQAKLAAEQLPMERLPEIYALSAGQFIKLPSGSGVLVMGVLASEESKFDAVKANLFIEKFLVNAKRNNKVEAELKRLREASSIEYMGAFASLNQAAEKVVAVNEVQALGSPPAPNTDGSIAKGVIGLK